ncbi:hypothetical protein FRC12_018668 [Ceratobasidium sp. 428]|nr:hypothetical protein FRC12_018668 [Ceratobasidium sp. 428]
MAQKKEKGKGKAPARKSDDDSTDDARAAQTAHNKSIGDRKKKITRQKQGGDDGNYNGPAFGKVDDEDEDDEDEDDDEDEGTTNNDEPATMAEENRQLRNQLKQAKAELEQQRLRQTLNQNATPGAGGSGTRSSRSHSQSQSRLGGSGSRLGADPLLHAPEQSSKKRKSRREVKAEPDDDYALDGDDDDDDDDASKIAMPAEKGSIGSGMIRNLMGLDGPSGRQRWLNIRREVRDVSTRAKLDKSQFFTHQDTTRLAVSYDLLRRRNPEFDRFAHNWAAEYLIQEYFGHSRQHWLTSNATPPPSSSDMSDDETEHTSDEWDEIRRKRREKVERHKKRRRERKAKKRAEQKAAREKDKQGKEKDRWEGGAGEA